MNAIVTPDYITELDRNEVFVFGSNLQGAHGGGAARIAYEKFGAEWGVGVGPTGQCYAIPTMQGGVETIRPYVDEFIRYAEHNPKLIFLVTRIGCGIAGFTDQQIAPLFIAAKDMPNVALPSEWRRIYGEPIRMNADESGLLEYTRFYKGEAACPDILEELHGSHGLFWDYERVWVRLELDPDDYYREIMEYFQRDFLSKQGVRHDIPYGLQAIFVNRLEHWGNCQATVNSLNNFINDYLRCAEEYKAMQNK